MSYITREMVQAALQKMQKYHSAQQRVHDQFGLDFSENRGRRNIIMSQAQEKFLAQELSKTFSEVRSDGRPGESDIFIGALERELECKITSPLIGTGAISLQTDYETLEKKGALDYLYIIACSEFEKFCVLHFEGLEASDFRPPSTGSRGRAQMIKHLGMRKCTVLTGEAVNLIERKTLEMQSSLEQIDRELDSEITTVHERIQALESCLAVGVDPQDGSVINGRRRSAIKKQIERARARPAYLRKLFNNRQARIRSKLRAWQDKPGRFTFVLEPLPKE